MRKHGIIFRLRSFWIGVHSSPEAGRTCVNLFPCITFWFGNPPTPKPTGNELLKLQFIRNADGASVDVECIGCNRCKNYVWVSRFDIEPPAYCAYCGHKFSGPTRTLSPEEAKKFQAL